VPHSESPPYCPVRSLLYLHVDCPTLRITASLPEIPIAHQSAVLPDETPERLMIPLGTVCGFQVAPPSVVATAAPLPEAVSPTARQSAVLAQEIPVRIGLPLRRVCAFQVIRRLL
jgi:hypothetical protein